MVFFSSSFFRKIFQFLVVFMILILAFQFSMRHRERGEALFFPTFLLPSLMEREVKEVFSSPEGEYLLLELVQGEPHFGILILLNGRVVGSFLKEKVLLQVLCGDRISIDAWDIPGPIVIRIRDVSPGILSFSMGEEYSIEQEMVLLGEVRLK